MWGALLFALVLAAADDPDALYREGLRLFSAGQPQAAIESFHKAIEVRPSEAATWKALGVVYAAQGDYARAEEPFHRACLLNARLPDACLYFGRALYLLDRFEQAVNVLRTALENDPQTHRSIASRRWRWRHPPKTSRPKRHSTRRSGWKGTRRPTKIPPSTTASFSIEPGAPKTRWDRCGRRAASCRRRPRATGAGLRAAGAGPCGARRPPTWSGRRRSTRKGARGHLLLGKAYQRLGKSGPGAQRTRSGLAHGQIAVRVCLCSSATPCRWASGLRSWPASRRPMPKWTRTSLELA